MEARSKQIDALVLAARSDRVLAVEGQRQDLKGLLEFAGRPSIRYTLDALRAARGVGRICVAGPERELAPAVADRSVQFVAGGRSLWESVRSGLGCFQGSQAVLVTTADLPLLTAAAVEEFLEACAAAPPGKRYEDRLFVSLVPEESFSGAFTSAAKGFQRFRDTTVCHGNVFLVTPTIVRNPWVVRRVDLIYRSRKVAWRTALAFGPALGISYVVGAHALRLLTLRQMATLASRRFRVEVVPIILRRPEIALDVDEPKDFRFVVERIGFRRPEDRPS